MGCHMTTGAQGARQQAPGNPSVKVHKSGVGGEMQQRAAPTQGGMCPDLLGFVDGPLEFLLQLPHTAHGGIVPGCCLLVYQFTPCLGLLSLHDLSNNSRGQPG